MRVGAPCILTTTRWNLRSQRLPVRLIAPVRRFWLANGELTITGIVCGAALLVLAYVPLGSWRSIPFEKGTYPVYEPSAMPLLVGWLLFALSLSLVVWPARWMPKRARDWWLDTQAGRIRDTVDDR